jgi:hypothetical protein
MHPENVCIQNFCCFGFTWQKPLVGGFRRELIRTSWKTSTQVVDEAMKIGD